MRLYGYGTIIRANLRDDWTVEVPLDLLPDLGAGAEPAAREEEAELPADDWTAALENKRPGLLKDLKPVNLHTIEQGIRMEVISALIRDQRLYVVFSAEDLEGDRLKADPVITLEPSLDYNTSSLIRLDYDTEKQKKVTCLKEFELVYPAEADQKIMLQFGGLGAWEAKRVDLLPLLEKYGKDAAVTALPENTSLLAHDQLSISSADVLMYPEILDYTQPLEESMGGTLSCPGSAGLTISSMCNSMMRILHLYVSIIRIILPGRLLPMLKSGTGTKEESLSLICCPGILPVNTRENGMNMFWILRRMKRSV